jgi:hypothetical protein
MLEITANYIMSAMKASTVFGNTGMSERYRDIDNISICSWSG